MRPGSHQDLIWRYDSSNPPAAVAEVAAEVAEERGMGERCAQLILTKTGDFRTSEIAARITMVIRSCRARFIGN